MWPSGKHSCLSTTIFSFFCQKTHPQLLAIIIAMVHRRTGHQTVFQRQGRHKPFNNSLLKTLNDLYAPWIYVMLPPTPLCVTSYEHMKSNHYTHSRARSGAMTGLFFSMGNDGWKEGGRQALSFFFFLLHIVHGREDRTMPRCLRTGPMWCMRGNVQRRKNMHSVE